MSSVARADGGGLRGNQLEYWNFDAGNRIQSDRKNHYLVELETHAYSPSWSAEHLWLRIFGTILSTYPLLVPPGLNWPKNYK
jgi:hypothetical protein